MFIELSSCKDSKNSEMIRNAGLGGSRELQLLRKYSSQVDTTQWVTETYWEHLTTEREKQEEGEVELNVTVSLMRFPKKRKHERTTIPNSD